MKSNIIVTGALGFIGKNFCYNVSKEFGRKIIFDKITYASDLDFYYSDLKSLGWELVSGDVNSINDYDFLQKFEDCIVVNFAAESHVDNSFSNAKMFMKVNAVGTITVAQFCLDNGYRLLHISTDEVYGEVTERAADEATLLNPTNPYSTSKAAADLVIQTYRNTFALDAKVIRANNLYGPRQMSEKVIPKAIKGACSNSPFYIHGNKKLIRHFLHVDDFTMALRYILDSWELDSHYVYNIAADEAIEILELVKRIYSNCGSSPDLVKIGDDRPFNDADYKIDDKRLRNLGWNPKVNFRVALDQLCIEKSFIDSKF